MPDLATLDPAVIRNAITKLEALRPRMAELENVDANLTKAKAELVDAKAELASVAAERDRTRTEYASARAELVAVLGGLSAAYKQHEELQRQIVKMEGNVR